MDRACRSLFAVPCEDALCCSTEFPEEAQEGSELISLWYGTLPHMPPFKGGLELVTRLW